MFGRRYFGGRYFGPRYFGAPPPATGVLPPRAPDPYRTITRSH